MDTSHETMLRLGRALVAYYDCLRGKQDRVQARGVAALLPSPALLVSQDASQRAVNGSADRKTGRVNYVTFSKALRKVDRQGVLNLQQAVLWDRTAQQ